MATAEKKSEDLVSSMGKKFGDGSAITADTISDVDRISTGVFEIDLAMGGGWPRSRVSQVYGPESAGKTNVILKTIATYQRNNPDQPVVFLDIEHSLDKTWLVKMGVNTKSLIVLRPGYAEQAVDMAYDAVRVHGVDLLVLDSIGALMTSNETDSSAEKMAVGGSSMVVAGLAKRMLTAIREANADGRSPVVLYVNQIRQDFKIKFGNPEKFPGGSALYHSLCVILRLYGKPWKDSAFLPELPVGKDTSFEIKKWKVPIVSSVGKFEMATVPYKGLGVGDTDEWKVVKEYLEAYGQLGKNPDKKNTWLMLGDEYPTLKECKARFDDDIEFATDVKNALIERSKLEVLEPGTSHGEKNG